VGRRHGAYQSEGAAVVTLILKRISVLKRIGEIAAFERADIAAAGLRHSRAPFPPERDCAESQSQRPTKACFVFATKEHKRNRASSARCNPSRGRDAFHPRPKLFLATFERRRCWRVCLMRSQFHVALAEVVWPQRKIWGPCGNGPYLAAVAFAMSGVWFLGNNVISPAVQFSFRNVL
jgi:hypothetical protein